MEKTIWVNGDEFILVEAESLSLEDDFMKYKPKTRAERDLKRMISKVIRKGVKNFYRPKCDPSRVDVEDETKGICFKKGKRVAQEYSLDEWKKLAKEYCPERNSRIGAPLEYYAFLGVLIKKLIEEGYESQYPEHDFSKYDVVEWAWKSVCINSSHLGHYSNSINPQSLATDPYRRFEDTGSRCVCGFCDLSNVGKILIDKKDFWITCCRATVPGYWAPLYLMNVYFRNDWCAKGILYHCVGWVILEK